MGVPGTAWPWVMALWTLRSAWGVNWLVSVALAGGPTGGVTVAVLTRVPVAVGSIWAVKLKVRVAPTGKFMVVSRAPVPLFGPVTVPPFVALTTVQVAAVTPSGRGSESVTPVASLGPALLTTMV